MIVLLKILIYIAVYVRKADKWVSFCCKIDVVLATEPFGGGFNP